MRLNKIEIGKLVIYIPSVGCSEYEKEIAIITNINKDFAFIRHTQENIIKPVRLDKIIPIEDGEYLLNE